MVKLLGENRLNGLKQLRSLLQCIWYGTPSDQSYLESRIKVLEAKLGRRAKQYQKLQKQIERLLDAQNANSVVEYSPEEYKDWTK